MPRQFTDMEREYIRLRAEGYPKSKCAEIAGYVNPTIAYVQIERRRTVRDAIIEACKDRISQELLPKAIRVFHDLLDEKSDAPKSLQLKAAAYITDRALELERMASAADVADKNPLDMSQAELEVFIARGRIVLKQETEKTKAAAELGIIDAEFTQ